MVVATPDRAAVATAKAWSIEDAMELYAVRAWSDGFYSINEAGHAVVQPLLDSELTIDISEVIAQAVA